MDFLEVVFISKLSDPHFKSPQSLNTYSLAHVDFSGALSV